MIARAAVLTLLGLAVSCQPELPKPVNLSEVTRSYRSREYRRVLDRWTRSGRITKTFDMVLDASATFKSWDFRQAYIAKFVEAYKITGRERDTMSDRELSDARQTYEVFFSAATSKYEWTDFSEKNSIWRVKLLDDKQREVRPIEIKRVKDPHAHLETFFPYVQMFSRQYLIRFPQTLDGQPLLTPDTKYFVLRFAGPLGTLDLRWSTEGAAEVQSAERDED